MRSLKRDRCERLLSLKDMALLPLAITETTARSGCGLFAYNRPSPGRSVTHQLASVTVARMRARWLTDGLQPVDSGLTKGYQLALQKISRQCLLSELVMIFIVREIDLNSCSGEIFVGLGLFSQYLVRSYFWWA